MTGFEFAWVTERRNFEEVLRSTGGSGQQGGIAVHSSLLPQDAAILV